MYDIKEVILRRGKHEKKRLVIEFTNPDEAIVGEFLMTDVPLLSWELLDEVKEVLNGNQVKIKGNGNRTSWTIDAKAAIIDDLFADMAEDIPSLTSCTMETEKLYELMKMWYEKTIQFGNK